MKLINNNKNKLNSSKNKLNSKKKGLLKPMKNAHLMLQIGLHWKQMKVNELKLIKNKLKD